MCLARAETTRGIPGLTPWMCSDQQEQADEGQSISHRTVENYRAWIMERMDACNVAELVRKVLILEADRPP